MKFSVTSSGGSDPFGRPKNLLDRSSSIHSGVELSVTQKQVDGLVDGFVHQATEWKALAAMTAGGMAYRLGRTGILATGGREMEILLQGASVIGGLSAEVASFELTHRSLGSLAANSPNSQAWKWSGPEGMGHGLSHSFITFGALKSMGRLTCGQNLILQHGAQDVGLVLSHQMVHQAGLAPKPEGTLAEQFLHAEITNLQLGAGLSLGHTLTGGKVQAVERALDLSASSKFPDLQDRIQGKSSPSSLLATASAGNGNEGRGAHVHFLLAEKKGEEPEGPKLIDGPKEEPKYRRLTGKFLKEIVGVIQNEKGAGESLKNNRLRRAFASIRPGSRFSLALGLKEWMDHAKSQNDELASSSALQEMTPYLTRKELQKLALQIKNDLYALWKKDDPSLSHRLKYRTSLLQRIIPRLGTDMLPWYHWSISSLESKYDYLPPATAAEILRLFFYMDEEASRFGKLYEKQLTVNDPELKSIIFDALADLMPKVPLEERLPLTLKIEEQLALMNASTELEPLLSGARALCKIFPHLPAQDRLERVFKTHKVLEAAGIATSDWLIPAFQSLRQEERLAFAIDNIRRYWKSDPHSKYLISGILEELLPHLKNEQQAIVALTIMTHLDPETLASVVPGRQAEQLPLTLILFLKDRSKK